MITCAITGSRGVLGLKLKKKIHAKFYEFKGDIRNKNQVDKWIRKKNFDILIHLAALVPTNLVNKNYKKAYDVNVNGTNNIIKSLIKKENKPKWIFFSSTSHVYKPTDKLKKIDEKSKLKPITKYGRTKLLAEKLLVNKLKKYPIKVCIGRIFSFTDKNQKVPFVIPIIKKMLRNSKKKITFENMNHYRDFLSTSDIVSVIDKLRIKNKEGIYNIGSGKKFYLKNIAKIFNKQKKILLFKDHFKTNYLISNNNKIKKLNWQPKKFNDDLKYFYK